MTEPSEPSEPSGPSHPTVVLPGPSAPTRTEGLAVLALVLAAVSWVTLPVLLAVVALVVAGRAERALDADAQLAGRPLVTAARWTAWIQLLVVAMVVAFLGAFFVALWLGR